MTGLMFVFSGLLSLLFGMATHSRKSNTSMWFLLYTFFVIVFIAIDEIVG